ncbi:MAG: hypothetical protein Fur0020_02140 [Thermodesulfovibrionia bacterium]
MNRIDLEGLNPEVARRFGPFIDEVLKHHGREVQSIHIVGSAVTPDFNEKTSDINSLIILKRMSIDFIEAIAPLGKRYGRKRISAPLIMTEEYISNSLDVFPIEFHDFKLIHKTILGDDILSNLEIESEHLRLQCERDIKTRLIGLRQGYISAAMDKRLITELLIRSFTGCIPLFRAILRLIGKEPPLARLDVIKVMQEVFSDSTVLEDMLLLKNNRLKPTGDELSHLFRQYYAAIEKISDRLDELKT